MPRTEIPQTIITRAGVAPAAGEDADMTNGMYFANNGRMFVEIVSTDAAPQTVGFEFPGDVDGQAIPDKTVTVPAGGSRRAGPWPTGTYNQTEDDTTLVFVNPSIDGATLKLAAYKLPTES